MADFYTQSVIPGATSPSAFGYHHGPIPNPNEGWVPEAHQAAMAMHRFELPQISNAENAAAPNPGSEMSSVNTGVCDIDMGGGLMCGAAFAEQPSLRRHIRTFHPGALANRGHRSITAAEERAGDEAIKKWILNLGWRHARYVQEPGLGPEGSRVRLHCDELEATAAVDPQFAARYGRKFHRDRRPPRGSRRLRRLLKQESMAGTPVRVFKKSIPRLAERLYREHVNRRLVARASETGKQEVENSRVEKPASSDE